MKSDEEINIEGEVLYNSTDNIATFNNTEGWELVRIDFNINDVDFDNDLTHHQSEHLVNKMYRETAAKRGVEFCKNHF